MNTKWSLSYIGYLVKKNLDVFNKHVVYKFSVLTFVIVFVVVLLALIF